MFDTGDLVPWNEIHTGARFGGNADVAVKMQPLSLVKATSHFNTKSPAEVDLVQHEYGSVKLSSCDAMILCAAGNPGGDAVCALETKDGTVVHEVQQDKAVGFPVDQNAFDVEFKKSVSPNRDFFVFLCTNACSVGKIPSRTAIVDQHCWQDYFGPFAARAFFAVSMAPPNANTAPRRHLEAVVGVGKAYASRIIAARATRQWKDAQECREDCGVPITVLKRLSF